MNRRKFLATAGTMAAAVSLPRWLQAGPALGPEEIEARVRKLVSQMTLDEKIMVMAGIPTAFTKVDSRAPFHTDNTPGCARLGMPGIRFVDGSRGIRFTGATCFPAAMARGATWDPELEQRVGNVIGYEGRAGGANFFGGVCINLLRHPSWGRSQETFGEDPYHLGRMGSSVVRGVQNHMMACAKHFAGNSIDKSRHYVDVQMDERTLREIYLPHFKACVDAGTASIMNAYNSLNGEPCAQNTHLLREILKGEWKFPGFVLSDFGSIKETVASANAGCDVEMDRRIYYDWKLRLAVEGGLVPMKNIDEAVARQFREQLRFIHLEGGPGYDVKKLGSAAHAAIALESAQKAIVLLKNEKQALPLDRDQINTLAVIGELADQVNLGATGSTEFIPAYVVTPLAGIRRAAGKIEILHRDGLNLEAAKKAAAKADAAVVIVGLTAQDENEGSDRLRLTLSDSHEALIQAVADANPRCIVVVQAGGAVIMARWKNHVPAIVMAWYSGMEGGNALADVLFGDINPSGKLPIVFPKSAGQLVPFDNQSPVVSYGYYHGYRRFDKKNLEPAFPFGFGLSYASFKYDKLRLSEDKIGPDDRVTATVEVTNLGDRPGEEVVQLYVGYNGSQIGRPVKDLKAFTRVALKPGETRTVSLELKADNLAFYNTARKAFEVEPIEYVVSVGPSSQKESLLSDSFTIV